MSDRSLSELEEFFLALSDGTRLRLLNHMRDGEVSVGYLSDRLEQSQPKISRHLAYLRSAGLVNTRRDGKWIYYRIAETLGGVASRSLSDALDWVGNVTGEISVRKTVNPEETLEPLQAERESENVGGNNYSNDIEIYLL